MTIHDNPYGVGLAYRYHLHEEVMHYASEIDHLEIPTEDHIIRHRALSYPNAAARFAEASSSFPCVAHGISLSIGSLEPLDEHYVNSTRRFLQQTGISVFSEHLAYHRMDGKDISTFLQMPFDDVSLEWLVQNYNHACELLGTHSFAVENVSFSFEVPGGEYSEPEFLAEFLRRTDATLLLDVTNLFNNCTNYSRDPIEYIHTLPPDRISQLHLAGGHYDEDGFLVDSHSFAVMDEVWDLYRECLKYTSANIVILERDYKCFPFREVMKDVRRARDIFYELRATAAPPAESNGRSGNGRQQDTGPPDFECDRFLNLRSIQRAILKSITDDEFRGAVKADSARATDVFPMEPGWLDRFCRCRKLDEMSLAWKETDRLNREDEERFRQWEWSQWAAQAQPAAFK